MDTFLNESDQIYTLILELFILILSLILEIRFCLLPPRLIHTHLISNPRTVLSNLYVVIFVVVVSDTSALFLAFLFQFLYVKVEFDPPLRLCNFFSQFARTVRSAWQWNKFGPGDENWLRNSENIVTRTYLRRLPDKLGEYRWMRCDVSSKVHRTTCIKLNLFWDVALCTVIDVYRRFSASYYRPRH